MGIPIPGGLGATVDDFVLEPGQDLVLVDEDGNERLRLDAAAGTVRIRTSEGDIICMLDAPGANLRLGGLQRDGDLLLYPSSAPSQDDSHATMVADANLAAIRLGSETPGHAGSLAIRDSDGQNSILLQGATGNVVLGRVNNGSMVSIRDTSGENTIVLNGNTANIGLGRDGNGGELFLKDMSGENTIVLNGNTANVGLGTDGNGGELFLRDASGESTIVLNGNTANVGLGRDGNGAELLVKDEQGQNAIVLNGITANIGIGTNGNGGDLFLKDDQGQDTVVLRGTTGNLGLGRSGRPGNIFVKNDAGENTIHLSGQTGDILLRNGDCAEAFDVHEQDLEPGDVMVIADGQSLRRCQQAYDRRVAGILSGAGEYRPGIVLDHQLSDRLRLPIALVGKVYCKVDASYGAISVGDLLTSSDTAGHAMKVDDPMRAFGAVIGKALASHSDGVGIIPVLVGLQ